MINVMLMKICIGAACNYNFSCSMTISAIPI